MNPCDRSQVKVAYTKQLSAALPQTHWRHSWENEKQGGVVFTANKPDYGIGGAPE